MNAARVLLRNLWRFGKADEKLVISFGDYLRVVGLRPTPKDHKPEDVVTFRRGGIQPSKMPRHYECAVKRTPPRPHGQDRRVSLGAAVALAGEVYLFPAEPTGKLNFRSFEERLAAALRETRPERRLDPTSWRSQSNTTRRAARKIANARKARWGWR